MAAPVQSSNPSTPQTMLRIARDAFELGLVVVSQSATNVVISNGSNNLTVGYIAASFNPSMVGGVDGSVSPFLGIGTANPGKILMLSSINTAGTIADVIDGSVAAQVLCLLAGRANDLVLSNSDGSSITNIRGSADLLGMGQ